MDIADGTVYFLKSSPHVNKTRHAQVWALHQTKLHPSTNCDNKPVNTLNAQLVRGNT